MPAAIEQYGPQCAAAGRAGDVRAWLVWGAVVASACAFLGLIAAAPLALAHGQGTAAAVLYAAFAPVCHQLPARSFYLSGHPLAVCARCTGLYAGFALGAICYPLARSLRRVEMPARVWLLVTGAPLALDFALGFFGLWANTHTSRLLTGALFGAAAACYVVPGLCSLGLRADARAAGGGGVRGELYRPSTLSEEKR